MRFVISESTRTAFSPDRATYRAFIYWQEGESEIEKSFSQHELVAEIARLTGLRQPTAYYTRALQCLQLLNGPTRQLPHSAPTTSGPNHSTQPQSP